MPLNESLPFVFINGERFSLMEDYRLPLYQYFPEGTVLYDPCYTPPLRVPLATTSEELGVTLRKLMPHGHYEAYFEDPLTGVLYPPQTNATCAYVTNLPPNTTADVVGRFFEAFDMVREADVFHCSRTWHCDERGWAVLNDPRSLQAFERTNLLEFSRCYFVHVALSDREPHKRRLFPPLQPLSATSAPPPTQWERMRETPRPLNTNLPQPRSANSNGSGAQKPNGSVMIELPIPKSAATASGINQNRAPATYIAAYLPDDQVNFSIESGSYWPPAVVAEDMYQAAARTNGPVYLLFVAENKTFFGYARLLPQEARGRGASGCPIEWKRHHLSLREFELRAAGGSILFKLREGAHIKPEVGMSLCELANCGGGPSSPTTPNGDGCTVPIPAPRGGRAAAAGGNAASVSAPAPTAAPASTNNNNNNNSGRGRGWGFTPTARGRGRAPAPPQALGDGLTIPVPASRRGQMSGGPNSPLGAAN